MCAALYCMRHEILEDSDTDAGSSGDCCDVCISTTDDGCEARSEMTIIAETVRKLPGFGKVKVNLYNISWTVDLH